MRYFFHPIMKPLALLFFISSISFAHAQTVQWATKVIGYSSQLTPIQYAASQALGKPNVLPAGGQNPNAWAPDKPNRNEYLKVGFDVPMNIQQIAIAESHNPSALYKIMLYDEADREYEVHTFNPGAIPLKGRMLNVFVEKTPYKVVAVKLEFDGAAVPDFYGIDAVAISDYQYPVIAFIPTPELLATGIVIEPLDEKVNSEYKELNPLLSPDGKTLYFSRRNHPQNTGGVQDKEDIWYSELGEDGKWQLARNIGAPLNNAEPNFINAISSITPDGTAAIMLLGNKYLGNGKMSAGVSVSTYENGKWTTPVPVTIANEYNLHERANYFLTNTRKAIIMAVERRDSHGDRDLYVSFLQPDSVWSEPLNLGNAINTAADESAPFLAGDDRTLYFSSKGFSGYGGADIYISRRLDDTWTNWSEPENLGPEINSPHDDLFFNIPNFSEYAYYSRGVSENNLDIYRARLPIFREPDIWVTVKGRSTAAATGNPVGAKVMVESLPGGNPVVTVQADPETGVYEVKLKAGQLYTARAEANDYVSANQHIDLRQVTVARTIDHKDFALQTVPAARVERDATFILNNIFFELNKSDLKPGAFDELNQLKKMMEEHPAMTVEISGHTCDLGDETYNLTLSRKRAEAVKQYLVKSGISEKRIEVAFFGERKPLVPNTSLENREKNRRVEFKIVDL
jgi:OmpA-OmpF porin, OOP family